MMLEFAETSTKVVGSLGNQMKKVEFIERIYT
jgi:hypothetical protein